MKHMIWKIFGSKGSRKRMICGVLALVLVCASLIGCASKQIGVDAVPQEVLDTQPPEISTLKNDEPTTPVEPTEVTDVTEAPKDTEAAEPETEPTEAPTEEEVKPTEPKATEATKPTYR